MSYVHEYNGHKIGAEVADNGKVKLYLDGRLYLVCQEALLEEALKLIKQRVDARKELE